MALGPPATSFLQPELGSAAGQHLNAMHAWCQECPKWDGEQVDIAGCERRPKRRNADVDLNLPAIDHAQLLMGRHRDATGIRDVGVDRHGHHVALDAPTDPRGRRLRCRRRQEWGGGPRRA